MADEFTIDRRDALKGLSGIAGATLLPGALGAQTDGWPKQPIRILVGFAAGEIPKLPLNLLLVKGASAVGVFWGGHKRANPSVIKPTLEDVFAMCARGEVKPVIAREYKLSEAPQALKDLGSRNTHGKVLVVP